MSDRNPEDRAIEQAWTQVMATGSEPRLLRGSEEADSGLVREYIELLGLLPYQLAAETPPPHLKEEIMARGAGKHAGAPVAGPHDAGAPGTEGSAVVPFERPTPAHRPAWRIAQAAVLAAGLVGLGTLSATVWKQDQQIARLSDQVEASALYQDEVLQARDEMRTLRSRLNMVTTVARQAYPLRMVSQRDSPQRPEGIVYVCGMHQQWYLSLRGLEPPAEGAEYHLWFMTEEGKIDGGVLDVRSDTSSEMEAQTMPAGTHGFLVTLEERDQPESLQILLGESAINL